MGQKPKQHVFVDGVESKACGKCKQVLPLSNYTKNSGIPDGLRIRCKKCDSESQAIYRKNNLEKIKAREKKYKDKNREKILIDKRKYAKKFREENLELIKSRELAYRITHRQEAKDRAKKWFETEKGKESRKMFVNKRRALKKELPSDFTTKDWISCKEYFNNKCAYCGESKKLQQEHFIPLSSNGAYTKQNIIPACQRCNFTKNKYNPFEWYPKQVFYSQQREQKILEYLNN